MKERPILFTDPMVRAILDGSKTQTRRLCNPMNRWVNQECREVRMVDGVPHHFLKGATAPLERLRSRHGQPGDRLWVREGWKAHTTFDHLPPREIPESHVWYLADAGYKAQSRGRAPMHMPRWASRILLEITGVRAERLQDIREADARAEGVTIEDRHKGGYCAGEFLPPSIRAYRDLWESINGAGSWDANPWVWVVEFKRVIA